MPSRRFLFESALLFLACLGSGLMGGATAQEPWWICVAWPPIGVALVAVYLRGRPLAGAYWLATALLLTLHATATHPPSGGLRVAAFAAGLATAYTLQLLGAAWLLRRTLGEATQLVTARQIAFFLAIAGPLHAAPAAAASALLAGAEGRVAWPDAAQLLLTQWRSDLLGGLLFAPLTMVALGRPRSVWGPRVTTVAVPLVVALGLLTAGQVAVANYERRVVRESFARGLESALREVKEGLGPVESASTRWMQAFEPADLLALRDGPNAVSDRLREFTVYVPWARSVLTVSRVPAPPAGGHTDVVTSATATPGTPPVGSELTGDPSWGVLLDDAAWLRKPAVSAPRGPPGARTVRVVVPCRAGQPAGFVAVELNFSAVLGRVGGHIGEGVALDLPGPGDDPPRGPTADGSVEFLGTPLAVRGTLTPEYVARHRPGYSRETGPLGVGLVVALAALLLLATGQAVAAAREVELRTAELRREVQSRTDAEGYLRQSEQWLVEAQRITRLGYWEWKAESDELFWSAVMTDLLGLQGSDVRLRLDDFLDRVHPADRDAVRRLVEGMPGSQRSVEVEFRVVRQDGTVRWFTSTVAAEAGRERGVIRGTALDVTERKRAEMALREGEARLRLALHSARMGTWEWVIGTEDLYWDLREEAIFGFAPGSFNRTMAAFLQRVHPEDRSPLAAELARFPRDSSNFAGEFRALLPSGEVRWVAAFGQVLAAEGRRPRLVGINFDITERKRADLVVQESELRHRLALEAGHMGTMVWDFRTERIEFDGRLKELFGVAGGGFDGSVAGFFRLVHADDRDAVVAHLSDSRCNPLGAKCQCEFRTRRPDGATRWLSGNGHVVPGDDAGDLRLVGIFFDITEAKTAEGRLVANKERLKEAQEIARVGSFEWNPDADAVFWSDEMYRVLGYGPGEVAPAFETFLVRVHPDDREVVAGRFEAALGGSDPSAYEFRVLLPSGEVRHLSVNARLTRAADGRVVLFSGTGQDVTERKREAEERQRFHEQLTETQRLESLGILAGGVAHDFNNLLTGILGNASLARELLPPESDLHEYLRPIEKSAEHAAQLCHQMLTYAGAGQTIHGTLDLDAVIAESDDLIKLSASRKANCRVELHQFLPPIEGDAGQIRQVLLNLVQNASEALPAGGGHVVVRTGRAEPGAAPPVADTTTSGAVPDRGAVWLEVSDDGSGMTEATRQRIFEPFFTTKFTGRGLGLSAVHGIVRAHGGSIAVTSRPGRGTTFRVTFPCSVTAAGLGPPTDAPTPLPVQWDAAVRRTALIVDDDPTIRGVAGFALKGLGFALQEAGSGDEAITIFEADPFRFQIAVVDLVMPGVDGREVIEAVRRRRPDMPVILMSGYTEDHLADLEFGGALSFLHKPFRAIDLTSAVRRGLARTEADPAAPQGDTMLDGSAAMETPASGTSL